MVVRQVVLVEEDVVELKNYPVREMIWDRTRITFLNLKVRVEGCETLKRNCILKW